MAGQAYIGNIDAWMKSFTVFVSPVGLEAMVTQAVDAQAEEMAEMNREQLEDGGRADGSALPPYKPLTVQIKSAKGQQTQPMNLRDTGSWQGRIMAKKYGKYLEIISTDRKDQMLADRFGEQILGLTEENMQRLLDSNVRPDVDKRVVKFFKV